MKTFAKLGSVVLVGLLTVGLIPPSAQAGEKVTPETYGMHANNGKPDVESGALRLNMFPAWLEVEPKKNQYNWTKFDEIVNRDESWNKGELMYVFAGTPKWAGKRVKFPKAEVLGKKSTSAPKRMKYFKKYATAVVKRYKGRISQYQTWNEMTTTQFWQGTPGQMARMTKILKDVVKKHDRKAKVLSASVQTHVPKRFERVAKPYLKALKKRKWPIDVATAHGYAIGLNNRYEQLKDFRDYLRNLNAPKRVDLWDTETNHSNGFPNNLQRRAYISRAYLDSMRLGFERTYWYAWTPDCDGFGTVQLCPSATDNQYYDTMVDWTVGSRVQKCSQSGKLVKCTFKGPDGFFDMVYAYKGKTTYKFSGRKEICPADGGSCRIASNKVKVNLLPQRVRAPSAT